MERLKYVIFCVMPTLLLLVLPETEQINVGLLEARLVDGISEREGRLEVRKANGTWGTVCDDLWNTQASIVVCNQLGFGGFGESALPGSYAPGTGQIWLDDVGCTSRETNLGQCSAQPWGQHNCAHDEDVGVVCHRSSVRLQPQNPQSRGIPYGSVQVLSGFSWLPICDINWNDDGARVACRSIGYEDGVPLCCSELASPISYTTSAVNITCDGTELSLDDCQLSSNRGCSALASAICYNEQKDSVNMTFSVRLVNGSSHWGRVEVRHRGVWGFVCEASSWTDAAASVVCKELGFHGSGVRFGGYPIAQLSGSAWVTALNCTGNETSLEQCVVEPWGQATSCYTPASVLCYYTAAPVVRLAGGGTSFGRVEIMMDGETYTVCDNNWFDTDAEIVCQELGFQSGQPVPQSYYGAGSGRVALDRLFCSTTDTSLLACRSGGWLQTDPSCSDHSKDASVVCFGAVQLHRGDHNTGILMILNGSTSYSVCSLSFSDAEATVACRELGFEHGRSLLPGSFGYWYAYQRLAIRCSGNETRISSCHSTLNNCMGSTEYASVHCYNGSLSTERFTDFCSTSNLVIGGSVFHHRRINKATWVSSDLSMENQIDHVCIGKNFHCSLQDVRVKRGADAASDHHLLVAGLKLKFKRDWTERSNQRQRNISALKDKKQEQFKVTLSNKFRVLKELLEEETIDQKWQRVKEVVSSTCKEVLGPKLYTHKEWISVETHKKRKKEEKRRMP